MTSEPKGGFRFQPTTANPSRTVQRPRLTRLLVGRFEHRLTTVVGAAGFGKSTALALAVENNRLDPRGIDVWLACAAGDDDPSHLLGGLSRALGFDPVGDTDDTIRRINDAIWSQAPADVVLLLDDAQFITSPDAVGVLTHLLSEMPTNGHLLLIARTTPLVPTAGLLADDQLLEIGETELAFDDYELDDLVLRRASSRYDDTDAPLPRHAATADLQLAAGTAASVEFLWEEILSTIDPSRLTQLKRCAVLDELDAEMVEILTGGEFGLNELIADVPLIDQQDGSARLHSLLRHALVQRLTNAERRTALSIAGDIEIRRDRHSKAVELFRQAGDEISARDAARDFVLLPTLKQDMESITTIRRVMRAISPGTAVATALEAASMFGGQEAHVAVVFQTCAEQARAENDDALEAQSILRILQASWVNLTEEPAWLHDRLVELAEHSDFAQGVLAHARSFDAQFAGDHRAALAQLDNYHHWGSSVGSVLRTTRLCDLGRPEMVGDGIGLDDLASLPPGSEVFVALALWMRGDAAPELALELVRPLVASIIQGGFRHPSVAALATATAIAFAAGDTASARHWADAAAEITASGVGRTVELCAHIAAASVASSDGDDERAAELMAPEHTGLDMPGWPLRPQLIAVPLVYLTRPESRPIFDRSSFGPTISAAVAAGQALVALRQPDGLLEAQQLVALLPWTRPNVLRAHVLPHHLAELASVAASTGNRAARDVLGELPSAGSLLHRVARDTSTSAHSAALDLIHEFPQQPTVRLHARLLGPMQLIADGQPIAARDWDRRPRVKELCALLLARRRLPRLEIIDLMWPDQTDERKALQNLRTTLSLLQSVLEPDRMDSIAPFFVSSDGDHLLAHDLFTSDVDEFERLFEQAQADDDGGLPGRALDTYMAALELYGGDYLDELDTAWSLLDQVSLTTRAHLAACRIAELVSAQGEPEQAARWARHALLIDPTSERAGRLLVASFDASGDRSAARQAAEHVRDRLTAAGISTSPATQRLFERIGVVG